MYGDIPFPSLPAYSPAGIKSFNANICYSRSWSIIDALAFIEQSDTQWYIYNTLFL